MWTWMRDVDILRVRADVDRGHGHLVCMRMDYWWMQMSIKKKQKSTYLAMVTGHMSIWLHCVQTHWRADMDDCEEK